jgi:hypothetical protein
VTKLWRHRIGLWVAVWFLLCAAGLFLHAQPRPALLALAIAATGVAMSLFVDVPAEAAPADWTLEGDAPVRLRGEDARIALLTRLVGGHLDAHHAGDRLRDHLLQLTDRRLMNHHGVSLVADPERAVALMPPELAAFVTAAPPYPRMTLAQITRIADRIEEL